MKPQSGFVVTTFLQRRDSISPRSGLIITASYREEVVLQWLCDCDSSGYAAIVLALTSIVRALEVDELKIYKKNFGYKKV